MAEFGRRLAALPAAVAAGAILVLAGLPAAADDVTDFGLSPSSGYAGSSFTATGADFPACVGAKPGQGVRKLWWDAVGGTLLGSVSGELQAFSVGLTVPGGATPGGHSVVAHCSWDGYYAAAAYTVLVYIPPPTKPPPVPTPTTAATTTTTASTTTAPPSGTTAPPAGTTSPPTTAGVSPPGTNAPGDGTTDPPATNSDVTAGGVNSVPPGAGTTAGESGSDDRGAADPEGGDGATETTASDERTTTTEQRGDGSREASGRPAAAARPEPKPGELVLGASAVAPGARSTVAGAGCRARSEVVLEAAGAEIGRATADRAGRFEAEVEFADLPPGRYEMEARCGARLAGLVDVVLASSTTAATSSLAVLAFFVLIGAGIRLLRRAIG